MHWTEPLPQNKSDTMKLKRILLLTVASSLICTAANTQEKPKARFSLALTAGANSYASISAMSGTQASYEAEAPSVNWTDKGLGFGAEGGVQIGPSWRIVLGGTFNFGRNPGYSERQGTVDPYGTAEDNIGAIPSYNAVASQYSLSYLAYTGFDYLFNISALPKLKPILGLRLGGAYASNSRKTDDLLSMGASVAETFYLKGAVLGGVDYFITDNFFIGATLNLFDYTYAVSRHKPQEGLASLAADAHNFGAIASPTLRIGFRFGK